MAWTAPRTWTDGELVTKAIMDPHVRDNFLAAGPHLIVRKSSDQSVTSSTVLVNDTALLFPVAANEVWQFQLNMLAHGAAAGDLKFAFTFPTSGVLSAYVITVASDGATFNPVWIQDTTSPGATNNFGLNGTAVGQFLPIQGVFVNGANAGNVQLQWAQIASSGTATTMKANSTLWAVKLA